MPDTSRFQAFGTHLVEVHDLIRKDLARLRASMQTGARPRQLRAHCLSFCAAVTRHHTGEDTMAFPALAEQFPELRPVLDDLADDHKLVAALLERLEQLDFTDPDAAALEVNGVEALLESHFAFEERKIVQALNELGVPEWTPDPRTG